MKISKRLGGIDAMVINRYQHIWDCCCDHGQLGMRLLERDAAEQIHFVDKVPVIMESLERRLTHRFGEHNDQWQLYTIDVFTLPIDNYALEQSHLIIIAGVGGELSLQIVQKLLKSYPQHRLDFILCPLRHQYNLRKGLAQLSLTLIDEELLKEQKWYYEIIHVANNNALLGTGESRRLDRPIVATGSLLWENSNALHQAYLGQIIGHYQRSLLRLEIESVLHRQVQTVLSEYYQILTELEE